MITGCAGVFQGELLPVDIQQSRQVLEVLRQKEATISTLRGLFQATIGGTGFPISQDLNGVMAYHQPDRVHLKGFIRIGAPIFDFHREGNHYVLQFPAEGRVISGQVDRAGENSEWDQTVLLSLRALDAVLGKIGSLPGSEAHVWKNDRFYRIDMPMPEAERTPAESDAMIRTWVDNQTFELQLIEYFRSSEDLVVSVECADYREVQDKRSMESPSVRLPFHVKATDHRTMGGTVTLTFREFILNAA